MGLEVFRQQDRLSEERSDNSSENGGHDGSPRVEYAVLLPDSFAVLDIY